MIPAAPPPPEPIDHQRDYGYGDPFFAALVSLIVIGLTIVFLDIMFMVIVRA